MWKGWNDSRYFPTFTPPYYCVFLGQDLESLCSGYLGDGAQRYPLGILKQHQTSKGAAVVLHVLSCIYKVQSRDLKCKAPNSYGLRWLPDCTPATRTLETQNTECGLVKFARVAGHCTGWAKGRPACFSRFVYVVDKNFYGSTMQKVQDAIYTSMAARKLGFAESLSVLRLHGFSIRQTSLRSLLYI